MRRFMFAERFVAGVSGGFVCRLASCAAAIRLQRVAAAAGLVMIVTSLPAQAQITTAVFDPTPVPCAMQAGAPKEPKLSDDRYASYASILEGRDMWCDADGLIVHAPNSDHPLGDGGDTSQREGWYWLGVWIRQNTPGLPPYTPRRKLTFDQALRLLEPNGDGVFYRHPKLAPWNNAHGKEFGFSRDQMEPLVAAMGVWGKTAELRRLWDALPEDALGKHTFNGSWVNPFNDNIAGWNCSDVQKRGCDATRDCSLKTDDRDCSIYEDRRSCPLQEDTRNCQVCTFLGCFNDPFCEIAKAAQNVIYKAEKDACEAAKAAQNLIYAGQKAACEVAKATQNVIYKAEKDACEVIKAGEKATCELNKAADLTLCRLTNRHSGDNVGPMTVNLFRRAMGENPLIPFSAALQLPPLNLGTGHFGETELHLDVLNRLYDASRSRDETGKELNMIVRLLMSALRFPTLETQSGIRVYVTQRPFSFGSFLATYQKVYGDNPIDEETLKVRIADGIRSGWTPDAPPVHGAVRWYHRKHGGGNPHLAVLYEPIIERLIYDVPVGTLLTSATVRPSPTITRVSPPSGPSEGGTAITITGTHFTPGTTVLVDGKTALNSIVIDSTTVTAVVPDHPSGPVDVTVTAPWPGGGTAVLDHGFRYEAQPFVTYLAEGATGSFFTTDIILANPHTQPMTATLRLLREDGGAVVEHAETLAPTSVKRVRVNDIPGLPETAVSTVITNSSDLPLIAERSMFWDGGYYGGHTEVAVSVPSAKWYFAEGSQGFFDTFVSLANPNTSVVSVTIAFLLEAGAPVVKTYTVAPSSRLTVHAGAISELHGTSFGIVVEADAPIVAERGMYFGSPRFNGGHQSVGVRAPSSTWFHAEGATGEFFDNYILVSNPNDVGGTVAFRFVLDDGTTITKVKPIGPNARLTVNVESQDPRLANAAVSTVVTCDVPVISERAMYWPGPFNEWYEAHNSFGIAETGIKWGLAEGRVGGDRAFETYILLANPGTIDGAVTATFLKPDGTTVTKNYLVRAGSRFNIHVNSMVPELVDTYFGTVITSTVPVAVERAMYAPGTGGALPVWAAGTNATATKLP